MEIIKVFDDGRLEFGSSGSGAEWTFTATGDYGIIPPLAETVVRKGIECPASHIRELIRADISVANLEVGLTCAGNLKGRGVRGDRELFLRLHRAAPFTAYSFANNHIRDAGAEELRKTFEFFEAENIPYVGGGLSQAEAETPLFLDCKGVKTGILAFAQKENQTAGENTPGANELLANRVLAAAE
ncbi:MAG: CapA family protein, partial [Victivallaceae bacterium]|nr:CapA family protein [Victivallaceae bacterium]